MSAIDVAGPLFGRSKSASGSAASHRLATRVVLMIVAAATWWTVFLAHGAHDYSDALMYQGNAAVMARSGTILEGQNWAALAAGQASTISSDVANPGYIALMAAVYAATGGTGEMWYGSLVSFVFYMVGCWFFLALVQRFLSPVAAAFCAVLVFVNPLLLITVIRPLSDGPFIGLSMILFWYMVTYPRHTLRIGAFIGLITVIRIQGIFYLPAALLLTVDRMAWRSLLSAGLRLGFGALPFLALMGAMPGLMGASAPVANVGGGTASYVAKFIDGLHAASPMLLFENINGFLKQHQSIMVLTPVFSLFLAALFASSDQRGELRLRWFVAAALAISVAPMIHVKTPPDRYFAVFIPFIFLAAWRFGLHLADGFGHHRRVATAGLVAFFLFASSGGLLMVAWSAAQAGAGNAAGVDRSALTAALAGVPKDGWVATNDVELLALEAPVDHVLPLPEDPATAVETPAAMARLAAIALVLNRVQNAHEHFDSPTPGNLAVDLANTPYLAAKYAAWAPVLEQGVLVDAAGRRFEKVVDEATPLRRLVVFLPVD